MNLDGKVVVVTGASEGLGAAMAKVIHEHGGSVVIAGRRRELLEGVAAEIPDALVVPTDVTVEEERARLVDTVIAERGRIDVLVNNAGGAWAGAAEHEPIDETARLVDLNLTSVMRLCQLVGLRMLARGKGSIVNVSSISALRSFDQFGLAGYAASKSGVHGLTRELAAQWGRKGIRVNAVAPGWFPGGTNGYLQNEELRDWIGEHTALGRPGRAEELAAAVVFLASDVSSYITGQVLSVDGGWTTY